MKNIVIIGYYNHSNIGDEQYKETFRYALEPHIDVDEYTLFFLDCDVIKSHTFDSSDIIILGGGDILNNYFMDQIITEFKDKPNMIIAVSVGMPYNDILLHTAKLDIIDFLFLRTEQDMRLFSYYFTSDRLHYIPDISIFLKDIYNHNHNHSHTCTSTIEKILENKKQEGEKIIAFCLNRHIYDKSHLSYYETIVDEFVKVINHLCDQSYSIVLLPFNVQSDSVNASENDVIIHSDIHTRVSKEHQKKVLNITTLLTVHETYCLFPYFDLVVPMRFHACLFSINHHIPFLPIFTTKKIRNLLLDIEWKFSYELPTNEKDIPTTIDSTLMIEKITEVLALTSFSHYSEVVPFLQKNASIAIADVIRLLHENKKASRQFIDYNNACINELIQKIQDYLLSTGSNSLVLQKDSFSFSHPVDNERKEIIIDMICYYLTKGFESKYRSGLSIKVFEKNYPFRKEWTWLLKDYFGKPSPFHHSNKGICNLNFINQYDLSDTHRSGWNYVTDNMKCLNCDNSELLLDLSVDKTFHWKEKSNIALEMVPYKSNWMGFIHHTFDTTFSEYNNKELLQKSSFIESLKYCKGLFVFSDTLKNKLQTELHLMGYGNVPVFSVVHPTECSGVKKFTWKAFLQNTDKQIIHVGGWLRNVFSFFHLVVPSTLLYKKIKANTSFIGSIRKSIIKGRNMDNYFPLNPSVISTTALENTVTGGNVSVSCGNVSISCGNVSISSSSCGNVSVSSSSCGNVSVSSTSCDRNNWNKHCNTYIDSICNDIEIIERLPNEEYDEVLSKNIVFINLVDASAVNTVLECIVRNTPIIINRHPAVVEMLGANYPLYFGDSNGSNKNTFEMNLEIDKLLSDTINLHNAYKYLLHMDKRKFSIDLFLSSVRNIIQSIE